ncbi:2-amino-4-hydroxy-6-hydroxymethyldihydropteridine diphosphokinase [Caulobacter radicis]|uniref:2-amino-4-hydroxy-6- hydroxymethyldihydropteridine diphosphokinase n=1 Tax=Caulobacter radicis TaxID=2172650 RepID=UPI000D56DA79|nr:2-amino-4-hydroxy-6-hydroxymethyldihydropteridine diphosphokinase [Caulobacter radicis]PVM89305.1 2-amino-4-hydroxy-6-hydroxymethyldihydropteridine diphosphokinase [Caulobacter radicis]
MVVALGCNLPGAYTSREALLEAAVAALAGEGLAVVARSGWWTSAAWPDPAGPAYLNGVALVETDLSPAETLAALHRIEAEFGRARSERNAARTLDLDLIAHGRTVTDGNLVLPHPRAHERLFVMGPLAEVAPDWAHPLLGESAAALAASASVGADAKPHHP